MKAYWFDNKSGDQRQPHDSGREVDQSYLQQLGIHFFPISGISEVDRIAKERQYSNRDEITISPTTLPDYENKVRAFFNEHLHEDEEIRYIMDGSGYFDVRSKDDDWVRIALQKDEMIIMPAGIYHRFTTDEKNYTKAMRLFKDEPKWTPLNRGEETDKNKWRQDYLSQRDGVPAQ
ncbi:hypothetical protein ANO11243_000370 [Dothideomycetidae sp. 11243]|nr:hypothetical protein ANO11243_000370 [fungal sp. No.11243]